MHLLLPAHTLPVPTLVSPCRWRGGSSVSSCNRQRVRPATRRRRFNVNCLQGVGQLGWVGRAVCHASIGRGVANIVPHAWLPWGRFGPEVLVQPLMYAHLRLHPGRRVPPVPPVPLPNLPRYAPLTLQRLVTRTEPPRPRGPAPQPETACAHVTLTQTAPALPSHPERRVPPVLVILQQPHLVLHRQAEQRPLLREGVVDEGLRHAVLGHWRGEQSGRGGAVQVMERGCHPTWWQRAKRQLGRTKAGCNPANCRAGVGLRARGLALRQMRGRRVEQGKCPAREDTRGARCTAQCVGIPRGGAVDGSQRFSGVAVRE